MPFIHFSQLCSAAPLNFILTSRSHVSRYTFVLQIYTWKETFNFIFIRDYLKRWLTPASSTPAPLPALMADSLPVVGSQSSILQIFPSTVTVLCVAAYVMTRCFGKLHDNSLRKPVGAFRFCLCLINNLVHIPLMHRHHGDNLKGFRGHRFRLHV